MWFQLISSTVVISIFVMVYLFVVQPELMRKSVYDRITPYRRERALLYDPKIGIVEVIGGDPLGADKFLLTCVDERGIKYRPTYYSFEIEPSNIFNTLVGPGRPIFHTIALKDKQIGTEENKNVDEKKELLKDMNVQTAKLERLRLDVDREVSRRTDDIIKITEAKQKKKDEKE